MNVALVSCDDLPGWEVDDNPLIEALTAKGALVCCPAWTDKIDWNQFDISVIRTTWDYHSKKDEFVAWSKTVPRLFNNSTIVEWNTHKSYLRELQQHGIAIAPTIWVQSGEKVSIEQSMQTFGVTKGFIKPQVGATASDTLRFTNDELESAQQFLEANLHQDMMVQPYIESVETVGELTAIFIDGEFTHGVQKIPVEGDYRVQDDFGASDMPYTFTTSEIEMMRQTLEYVPMHEELLYARFDYLLDDDGKLVLNELELVEPSLFFRHCKKSAHLFADAIMNRVMMSG
jgi:glutathione synthase/RimK-type ligase-like ATP-grasp enzyme